MTSNKSVDILIVEDDVELGKLYAEWLSGTYSVRRTASKDEALAQFDESIDIALLDRRLELATGDEVLEEIRQSNTDCQVAMITGVEPDFDIIDMGFDGYLRKPVDRGELHALVSRLETRVSYSRRLQRMLTLTEKRVLLESQKSQAELDGSKDYQLLINEIANLQSALNSTTAELKHAEMSSEAFWRTVLAQ